MSPQFLSKKSPVVKASKDMSINTLKKDQVYLSDFWDPRRWVEASWRMKQCVDPQNQTLLRPMGARITSIIFPPMRWELTKLNKSRYPHSKILSPYQSIEWKRKEVLTLEPESNMCVPMSQGWNRVLVSLFSWPGQLLSLNPCRRPKILARMLFLRILSLTVVIVRGHYSLIDWRLWLNIGENIQT